MRKDKRVRHKFLTTPENLRLSNSDKSFFGTLNRVLNESIYVRDYKLELINIITNLHNNILNVMKTDLHVYYEDAMRHELNKREIYI
jgi:hypothetical protein